jgi:hypothetical protein
LPGEASYPSNRSVFERLTDERRGRIRERNGHGGVASDRARDQFDRARRRPAPPQGHQIRCPIVRRGDPCCRPVPHGPHEETPLSGLVLLSILEAVLQ